MDIYVLLHLDMADGDYVEIQCDGASPEDEGRIQWYFNNRVCDFNLLFH